MEERAREGVVIGLPVKGRERMEIDVKEGGGKNGMGFEGIM